MIITDRKDALEAKAAELLGSILGAAVTERGRAIVAVPGGRSVGPVLQGLDAEPVDWSRVHVFMVDERLVPAGHPDSNFGLVSAVLGPFVPAGNLHPFVRRDTDWPAARKAFFRQLIGLSDDLRLGFKTQLLALDRGRIQAAAEKYFDGADRPQAVAVISSEEKLKAANAAMAKRPLALHRV